MRIYLRDGEGVEIVEGVKSIEPLFSGKAELTYEDESAGRPARVSWSRIIKIEVH